MADKIQNAYESSKNIYDDVLTQGNLFSRMYIKIFWSGTDDNEIARKYPIFQTIFPEIFWMSRLERPYSRNTNGHP